MLLTTQDAAVMPSVSTKCYYSLMTSLVSNIIYLLTEHHGRLVNTSPLYSASSYYPEVFMVFSVPPGKCWDNTLKLGHNHFLKNPVQVIIHLSPYHLTLYSHSC
jgi:hypothetical protein